MTEPTKSPQPAQEVWGSYWRTGRTACCCGPDSGSYLEELNRQWNAFFRQLRDSDAILDLCTGNGAVLALAAECANDMGISVDLVGVDSADIDPLAHNPALRETAAEVKICGNTPITDLPFSSNSFDFVSSQFGIEYAPLATTAPEIMRVMKTGGSAQFIVHAAEGVTCTAGQRELDDIDELLDDIDIFAAAQEAIRHVYFVESAGAGAPAAAKTRAGAAYDGFIGRLQRIGDDWQSRAARDVYRETGKLLQHTFAHRGHFSLDVLQAKIAETEDSVVAHRERLRQLVAAAMSEEGCEVLVRLYSDLGCREAANCPLFDVSGEHLLGWKIKLFN